MENSHQVKNLPRDPFEIKEISFTANPSNIDLLPLNVILASIGQQSLTVDLNTYSEVFDKGLMLKIISKLGLNIIGEQH